MIEICCFLINKNTRSKAYLQKLIKNDLIPNEIFILDIKDLNEKKENNINKLNNIEEIITNNFKNRKYYFYEKKENAINPINNLKLENYCSFDYSEDIFTTLDKNKLNYNIIKTNSINSNEMIELTKKIKSKYIIFSGGGVLGKEILSIGKSFIHVHPALLPEIKGSMGIEWSILLKNKCYATAILMEEKIDFGKIIKIKEFDKPKKEHGNISPLFCPHIRSELLIEVIKEYKNNNCFFEKEQNKKIGRNYFKMHSTLNEIVFRKCL